MLKRVLLIFVYLHAWKCMCCLSSHKPSFLPKRVLRVNQDRIEEQKSALGKSERDLRFAMPKSAAQGLDAVERLVKEQVRAN